MSLHLLMNPEERLLNLETQDQAQETRRISLEGNVIYRQDEWGKN